MEQPKKNFKIVSDKKARIILPNAITLIGICIGLTSIKFAQICSNTPKFTQICSNIVKFHENTPKIMKIRMKS